MTNRVSGALGRALAHYLNQPVRGYEPFSITDTSKLAAVLHPADVLLVEGNRRVSTAIKYLTQSSWSHAALFVGDFRHTRLGLEAPVLIEADIQEGVVAVPLTKYAELNTRVCRPAELSPEDRQRVCDYVIARLGHAYDLRNVFDLARYLLPVPPVPVRWRRRMLAFGSGDPTRAICSTLIAQAFQSVRFPILPRIERLPQSGAHDYAARELLHIRHYSLFTPRDFDISPFFRVIKPSIENGFDYHALNWAELPPKPDGLTQD
jgi:Permuted papain-like amidase enzyme, YaeF/YiiX, C92 family